MTPIASKFAEQIESAIDPRSGRDPQKLLICLLRSLGPLNQSANLKYIVQ